MQMHSDFRLRRLIFFAKRKEFTFLFKNAVFTKKKDFHFLFTDYFFKKKSSSLSFQKYCFSQNKILLFSYSLQKECPIDTFLFTPFFAVLPATVHHGPQQPKM